jgi:hypothetical protein
MTEQSIAVVEAPKPSVPIQIEDTAMGVEQLKRRAELIEGLMTNVMRKGQHYGVIPGCGDKPTLLKPGAEKLCSTFRLAPTLNVSRTDLVGGHREYEVIATLTHTPTGQVIGQGVGACSTMESKYRYRQAKPVCPSCGSETLFRSKEERGGGWFCWQKKGGCGRQFEKGDASIENQDIGKVEYEDPADYYNTILKMAKKRALVDAALTATAASDIFTQDIEDMGTDRGSDNTEPPPGDEPPPHGDPGTPLESREELDTKRLKHLTTTIMKLVDNDNTKAKEKLKEYIGVESRNEIPTNSALEIAIEKAEKELEPHETSH